MSDRAQTHKSFVVPPNAREGLVAPVALVGAQLPNGLTIKRAKIRGEESQGMLCSATGISDISDEASGLMELPDDTQIGAPIVEALGLDDVVLELEITPNRPDCLSMIGVAREISVSTGKPTQAARSKYPMLASRSYRGRDDGYPQSHQCND